MKKKGLVLLVCLALVATLAVNGTFASELQTIYKNLTNLLGEVLGTPTTDVEILDVKLNSSSSAVLSPSHYDDPFAWSKVTPVVHTTYVTNTKAQNAYVRISILVKNDDVLMHTEPVSKTGGYDSAKVEANGYTVYNFDYTAKLAQNGSTPDITMDVALVKETTNADLTRLGSDFIQVKSFAIQADVFTETVNGEETQMSYDKALEAALGKIDEFNPFN